MLVPTRIRLRIIKFHNGPVEVSLILSPDTSANSVTIVLVLPKVCLQCSCCESKDVSLHFQSNSAIYALLCEENCIKQKFPRCSLCTL
jgi:hypothetical protein